ncbi:hypothetical protein [Ruficoccus sp. ZRK36]|uniref:hypothetical protein n=1 Tax=Ruficoccus sp. ZRK36 TaxID=2866311 RepID=UPI001C733360|nr:hypothetical protein [Ruficoccus sp. ZRK36]QYY36486.1 hypothetical protein K0V07_03215 [Ruficoccus sp. ZRK36]
MVYTASLEEWLVPVVVFVIWAINAAISLAKKKQGEGEEEEAPRRNYTPLDHPSNDDAERTRRIQEEIRRKIAERRGGTVPQQQEESEFQPAHQPPPIRRTAERTPSPLEAPRPMTSPREVAHRRQRMPEPTYTDYRDPTQELMAQLEARQREAKEAEQRAEAIRRQSREKISQSQRAKPILKKRSTGHSFSSMRSSIKQELKDPESVRRAVLHYEILGTPVGLRRDDQLYPQWKS